MMQRIRRWRIQPTIVSWMRPKYLSTTTLNHLPRQHHHVLGVAATVASAVLGVSILCTPSVISMEKSPSGQKEIDVLDHDPQWLVELKQDKQLVNIR